MAYLMVMMQAFFLFLCFLLLEESSCNEANVAAKMLDAQLYCNSQRKKKKHAQRNCCCCCALFFRVLDGGFGILEFAAGN
jgi:hypothetical protein